MPATYTYQQSSGSAALNNWLSEPDSAAPYRNIGAYQPFAGSGSGAYQWGSVPSTTGATRGSGQGRKK
ncbi:hypothetical protein CkaCkLH20_08590 [Colletotrichum karsti]|uniref:Uncharacterized protein n=1 Tax=Colletotrichum karsti TaxID=1095194 RepID=A0A9P6LI39_9PEZI|nr:uncharacterized protein CkaCkLH20_08590 [Colletotrichum karsti]KAF9873856.1 hypothetical protein CkaCkLH20_08590 [Colletotrichum karsti]